MNHDFDAAMKTLPLYYWADQHNFGDELSRAVVETISGFTVREARDDKTPRLFAVGSILERARDGDIAWGAGIHPAFYDRFWKPATFGWKRRLLFRVAPYDFKALAVRGPLTRDALLFRGNECPEIYGDPAILLPTFYPKAHNPIKKIGVVPHYSDKKWFSTRGIEFIDVAQPWQRVVDQIVECESIIATSLHGIIVAEAYGVPAIWCRMFGSEGMMKYADYYLGTERLPKPVYSYEEARQTRPLPPPDFVAQRERLAAAFDKAAVGRLLS